MHLKLISFLKSFSFFKGVLKTVAVLLPIGLGWYFDALEIGIPVGLSIIAISPSDIPGNRKHHIGGLLVATFLAMVSSFFVNVTYPYPYLLELTIFVLTFFNAYISLYGFRASMVAFSGLFCIASTLSHIQTGKGIYLYLLYIFISGMWYISLVLFYLWVKPRQYSEQLLGKCFSLTSEFFSVRSDLLLSENRTEGFKKMIDLQTNLNENYEKLREVILDSRSKSGKTDYLQRQFLMFIELVDIFELALANPVQYEKIDKEFAENKDVLQIYADFLQELSKQLQQMSVYIGSRKQIKLDDSLKNLLLQAKLKNEELKNQIKTESDKEKSLTLRNFYIYIENQYKSIEKIRVIFDNYYSHDAGKRDEKTYRKFVSYQNYSWKRLKDHMSFKSSFFRHSIRLSVTTLIAYLIGNYFSISNAYWILLTIFLIMRPGFGLTKERSLSRIYGTILGGVIAFAVIFLFPQPNLYLYFGVLCMPIAFGLMQENYMYASIFITITAIFMFALISPDVYSVIHDRLLDTAIGVGLAFVANYLLFPSWESRTYQDVVQKSIQANVDYLKQVKIIFNENQGITNTYKVSRKEAFLALSNLNAAFQRMLQEPKSKQNDNTSIYEIIVIQQSFLASVASLGVRLKSKQVTFPKEIFNETIDSLISLLKRTLLLFTDNFSEELKENDFSLEKLNQEMQKIVEQQQNSSQYSTDSLPVISMRETHLYWEQFNYLFGLVKNLEQAIKQMIKGK
ncbi:FUSC family protein [Capnocytophaga stomatis]|uniref:FUSC family membrane protein n=1 Tax=Capnocytophaga stomatis TaxID=1848904 RepID=A0ABW8QD68_9FLAO|nr:FUSC family membrane protein [Capnocytophaga stomatis]GIJ94959.1 membrane protein [Capnocytophaga stomatis]GIJ95497.1 membrane protein [Capnocytophaga stomatis]